MDRKSFHYFLILIRQTIVKFTPYLLYFVIVLLLLDFSVRGILFKPIPANQLTRKITLKILTDHCHEKETARLILDTAELYEIDPFLLYAVAKVNSNFNRDQITSFKNGERQYGLMQILSRWYPEYTEEELLHPSLNLKLGAKQLKTALSLSEGKLIKALALYRSNANSSSENRYGQATLDYIEIVLKEYNAIQTAENKYSQSNYDLLFMQNE